MEGATAVSTPLGAHFRISAEDCPSSDAEKLEMSKVPYMSAVGSVMYAMVSTRPDIAHAVSVVSRYMSNPGRVHWNAVKWILRYLRGTPTHGICFGGSSELDVRGYVDSDYAGDLDKRKSITGFVYLMAGGAVSWRATLQSSVALSTTEAEYMAAAEAAKEGLWLGRMVEELGRETSKVSLLCDSQSAIHLAHNPITHSRSKHIEVRHHFIREVLESGELELSKVGTLDNAADALTKTLSGEKFRKCLHLMGVQGC